MRGPARMAPPRADGGSPQRSPAQARPTEPRAAAGAAAILRLHRTVGNRAVRAVLARDDDAAKVEEKQEAQEAAARDWLKPYATSALAMPMRGEMVRAIGNTLINLYAPDSKADVSGIEYEPARNGIAVKDVGKGGGKVVLGDDALRRLAAGAADQVGQELRGAVGDLAAVDFDAKRPAIVWVGGERVKVKSVAEAKDAERIVKLIKDNYGIVFDSVAARRAIRTDRAVRGRTAEEVRNIDVQPWAYMDLRNLEIALGYFKDILGKARGTSSRASSAQEVTVLGRLSPPPPGHDRGEAEAEFRDGAVAVYESQPEVMTEPDASTAVHEVAHAIFGPLVDEFKEKMGWWSRKGRKPYEAPPTRYGARAGPEEDLADSVSMFFVSPDTLLKGSVWKGRPLKKRGEVGNACPERFKWIEEKVKAWTPAKR